jgi:NADPH:quinone reductase-like Zn-dependent oxidoreductase
MRAVRYHAYGDPDVLRYEEVEQPQPATGQVRIRVAATSFNPVDASIRAGNLQGPFPLKLPHIPGIDVAGTVDALGDDVQAFKVGDQVIGFLPMVDDGASAEFALAPADILAPAPSSIPLADAAALPVVGLAAWQALFDLGKLDAGKRILINGAGGALGLYAVQLAKITGAYVIATASPHSNAQVKTAGADEIIDHTTSDLTTTVTEPVDVALNLAPIEPAALATLVTLVRPGGVVVNTAIWMQAPSDAARDVRGIDLFVRSDAKQLTHLVEMVDRGELRVDVAERVPLAELAAVHARAATSSISGKIIIIPA